MTPLPGKAGGAERRTLVLLGALCLFLSTLEYLIPKPLPFIRIGLANLPLLLALDLLSPRYFALLTLIKIAGGGIVGGSLFSYGFLFSLGGSAASSLVMYGLGLARRRGGALRSGLSGIGTAGALCSTGIQLLLARFLIFGQGARYLVPPFLAAALITGFALGLFCEYFCGRSRWYALKTGGNGAAESGAGRSPPAKTRPVGAIFPGGGPDCPLEPSRRAMARQKRRDRWDSLFDRRDLAIAAFPGVLLFLFNPSTLGRGGQFLFFWFCAWLSGRKIRPLITLLVIAGVVLVNLLSPYGRVLLEIGPFPITGGSLAMGIRKGITLEGLFMLSSALIRGGGPKPATPAESRGADSGGFRRGLRAFRGLLEESLAVFTVLRDRGGALIRPGHFAGDLDALFLGMEGLSPAGPSPDPGNAGPGGGAPSRKAGLPPRRARPLLALGLLVTAIFSVLPAIFKGLP